MGQTIDKNHTKTFSLTFFLRFVPTLGETFFDVALTDWVGLTNLLLVLYLGVELFRREEVTKALLINGSGKRRC